ncbi:MAG: hypothetical protein ACRDDZ_06305 [Marinifilaceae bacterium]
MMGDVVKIRFVDQGQDLTEMTLEKESEEFAVIVDTRYRKVFIGDKVNLFLTKESKHVYLVGHNMQIKYPVKSIRYVKDSVRQK